MGEKQDQRGRGPRHRAARPLSAPGVQSEAGTDQWRAQWLTSGDAALSCNARQ